MPEPDSAATHYRYRFVQLDIEIDLAPEAYCTNPASLGALTSVSQPISITPNTFPRNRLAALCVRGYSVQGDQTIAGDLKIYAYIKDLSPPNALTVIPGQPGQGRNVKFAWQAADQFDGPMNSPVVYDFSLSANADCSGPLATFQGISATSVEVENFQDAPPGVYYSCLFARDLAGNQEGPAIKTVTVGATPEVISITSPLHSQVGRHVSIGWTASNNVDAYRVRVSTSPDCSNPYREIHISQLTYALPNFPLANFYICVDAINASAITGASNNSYKVTISEGGSRIIFMTSDEYSISEANAEAGVPAIGKFHSAAEADYHCTRIASEKGLIVNWNQQSILFKAMLSEGLSSVVQRASMAESPYNNMSRYTIASTLDGLLIGIGFQSKQFDNFLFVQSQVAMWTGATYPGTGTGINCNNWTQTTGSATVGNFQSSSNTLLNSGTLACNKKARLVCTGLRETLS